MMPGPESPVHSDEVSLDETEIVVESLPPPPTIPPNYLSPGHEPEDGILVILNADRDIFVTSGVPTAKSEADFKTIDVPNSPHVFMVQKLTLKQNDTGRVVTLQNVPVILGHAMRAYNREANLDEWRFVDGAGVIETIEALDKYCEERKLPKVEVIATCNDNHRDDDSGVALAGLSHGRGLVQVIGQGLKVPPALARLYPNGATKLWLEADSMVNLDELIEDRAVNDIADTVELIQQD